MEKIDVTSKRAKQIFHKAFALPEGADVSFCVILHGSLPCTGGSPIQNANIYKAPERIEAHKQTFIKLLRVFTTFARICHAFDGYVSFELPAKTGIGK